MRRFQALGARLAAAGILVLVSGCGPEQGGEPAPEALEVETGGTAVVATLSDISTPVLLVAQTELDTDLAADVMNMQLLRGDWKDGRIVYATAAEHPLSLARRYEYLGPDSSAVRFHLRSDVKWSDGRPLTARDVVFTYELARNPALASARQDYVERLDSVVAQNDSVVTFHFERRYPEMLTHTGIAPVPQHVYAGVDPAQLRTHPTLLDPANGNLVVSGPFMIGEWRKGERVVLVPNPHFQPRPNLDQLVFRVIPEPTTRMVELQTGNVDLVRNLTSEQLAQVRAQPKLRIEREEKRWYDYVGYNPKGFAPFADPEVRRALGMAIDAPQLIRALQMEDFAVPAGGPYSPIFRELYDEKLAPPLAYDPERAKQILAARGWRDTDGDGILDKDGRPFRFTLMTNTGNARRADASQIVQQQWRQIGVDARLQQQEFNVMFDRMRRHDYQAVLAGWGVNLTPDLTQLWGPDSPFNIVGYRNPEVTALFEQAQAQPTARAAAPYWQRAAAGIAQDQPYTWLYFMDGVDGVSERLRGVEIDTYGPYQNTWEWWIPRAQQRGAARPVAGADSAR